MISCGVRETIKFLVQNKLVSFVFIYFLDLIYNIIISILNLLSLG